MEIGTQEVLLFSLILMRMTGFIFFNPIFGRSNIPKLFLTGFTVVMTIVIYPTANLESVMVTNVITFSILLVKELFVGFVMGFIVRLFEMIVTYAGTIIDFQMGLSMATIYDPASGSQTALTGTILQIFFLLLFFAVDGHLALIKIVMTSGDIIPYAAVSISPNVIDAVLVIFIECIGLAIQLAFPIIAFEFIVEVGIGLLMKIIPQINLFIMSIQIRVIVGLLMISFMISPFGDFIVNNITQMVHSIQDVLQIM